MLYIIYIIHLYYLKIKKIPTNELGIPAGGSLESDDHELRLDWAAQGDSVSKNKKEKKKLFVYSD